MGHSLVIIDSTEFFDNLSEIAKTIETETGSEADAGAEPTILA